MNLLIVLNKVMLRILKTGIFRNSQFPTKIDFFSDGIDIF
jgi:hypothetical protein